MVRHRQPGSLYGLSHAWLCSYIGDRFVIKCQLPPRPRQLNSPEVVRCTISNIHFAPAVLFMIVSPPLKHTKTGILGKYTHQGNWLYIISIFGNFLDW